MGLTTWKNSPDGRILKTDTTIAKNYLQEKEIKKLERTVSSYFDYIESLIERENIFTMAQFAESVDKFLTFNEYKILPDNGKVSAIEAKEKAEQEYIEEATKIINYVRANECIDGITYTKQTGKSYSFVDIFDLESEAEVFAYLDKNAIAVEHSLYDHVVYDNSGIERDFATELDNDGDVKLFFKIPDKFKIPTPIGNYTPDWAVYVETDNEKKLYFVIETKGSTNYFDLRDRESIKIKCGKKHFEALDQDVSFDVAKSFKSLKAKY